MIKWGVASLHLPTKYPQLPAFLVGQIGTLIWRIGLLRIGSLCFESVRCRKVNIG